MISEIQCTNKTCISHQESIEPKIHETVNQKLYCHYCGKLVE
ncbi:MAG: hypothetical protein Q7S92_00515 [Candidatus Diapherotrites archaeon]|nr:hypothetical protein [Candidatus Diapherotrites archaeon]